MKTSATAKYIGTPARKTGLVAALIRGRRVGDALVILRNTDKRASVAVGKVLDSAIANAENNYNAKAKDLVIESVLIGPGPSLKRSRPRAKGSASAILKRSSHITVVLTDGKLAEIAAQKTVKSDSGVIETESKATSEIAAETAKTTKPAKPAKKEAK
jgi:large subunit ribosomal protein L22